MGVASGKVGCCAIVGSTKTIIGIVRTNTTAISQNNRLISFFYFLLDHLVSYSYASCESVIFFIAAFTSLSLNTARLRWMNCLSRSRPFSLSSK